jgi:hypothetical protein
MGLQGGTYDGWEQKSFLSDWRLTSAPTTREPLPSPTTPPLIRALSAERPHQNEHHREPGEKPKMHPPFEFGLARPSPITVIDQERSQTYYSGWHFSSFGWPCKPLWHDPKLSFVFDRVGLQELAVVCALWRTAEAAHGMAAPPPTQSGVVSGALSILDARDAGGSSWTRIPSV